MVNNVNDIIIINGKKATISYRQSRSQQKEEPKIYTIKVMNALDLLLQGNRNKVHKEGINTLKSFTTMDAYSKLRDTRVSNAIIELRKVIPKSGIITFRYLEDKVDRYALINDEEIISFADNLLNEIREKISNN